MPRATFRPIVWFSLFNLLCDASTASWLIISHSAINFLNATLEFLCDAEESYSSKVKFRSLVIPCFYSLYSADLVNSGHNNVKKRTVVVWTNQLSIYVKKMYQLKYVPGKSRRVSMSQSSSPSTSKLVTTSEKKNSIVVILCVSATSKRMYFFIAYFSKRK